MSDEIKPPSPTASSPSTPAHAQSETDMYTKNWISLIFLFKKAPSIRTRLKLGTPDIFMY